MSSVKMNSNFAPYYLGWMLQGRLYPPKDTQPSFTGRHIIVTGANTGVGFEAAVKFVKLGAVRVILGVRSLKKGDDAKARIEHATGRKEIVDVWQLDMLDYDSIRAFARRAETELPRLDIAVLNAGVASGTYQQSSYGWENTLQINLLSTTLLALLLTPPLRSSRTVDFTPVLELISSSNHYLIRDLGSNTKGDVGLLERQNHPSHFDTIEQYSVAKLFLQYAQVSLARLAISSKSDGKPDFYVINVCPGATKSDLARGEQPWYVRAFLWVFTTIFQKSTEEGSRSYISGAALGEQGHGRFYEGDVIRE